MQSEHGKQPSSTSSPRSMDHSQGRSAKHPQNTNFAKPALAETTGSKHIVFIKISNLYVEKCSLPKYRSLTEMFNLNCT